MTDNRKKLRLKDELLWSRVAEKSDGKQVEFRRRSDLLDATHFSSVPIWTAIDTKTKELKLASRPRRLWIEWGIFSVGALINWLFAADGRSYTGFGGALMIGAGCSHLLGLAKRFILESEVQKLVEQQSSYLFHWLGTGASSDDFWNCRRAAIRKNELEESSMDSDLWRAQIREIEVASENRFLNIKRDILWRASGDYQVDWIHDLDGVNLPAEVGEATA